MKLDPEAFKFGGAQKFPLRYSWIPKAARAVQQDVRAFDLDSATMDLGVGSAMVKSMKYWMFAAGLLNKDTGKLSDLGRFLFGNGGADPYLEDEGTLWLIHWMLTKNAVEATALFWFFNLMHQTEFTSEELTTNLSDFVTQNLRKRQVARGTIDADIAVILRMYSSTISDQRAPIEDTLDSPLCTLDLLQKSHVDKRYFMRFRERASLPNQILGYAVLDLMVSRGSQIVPLDDLMYSKDLSASPGASFRLTENELIRKLEELSWEYKEFLEFRESNGLNQLFLKAPIFPEKFISDYYGNSYMDAVA
ncbi:MAG: DUF4007 family protein [Betaproteobacteria bacterium]